MTAVLLVLLPVVPLAHTIGEKTAVKDMIADVFSTVLDAERAGGDTTELVASLNEALSLVGEAERSSDPMWATALSERAKQVVEQVRASAWNEWQAGLLAQRNATAFLVFGVCALAVTALLAYLFVPRVFWMLWLRVHRDWRVRPR